jgi:hypothetical protein
VVALVPSFVATAAVVDVELMVGPVVAVGAGACSGTSARVASPRKSLRMSLVCWLLRSGMMTSEPPMEVPVPSIR